MHPSPPPPALPPQAPSATLLDWGRCQDREPLLAWGGARDLTGTLECLLEEHTWQLQTTVNLPVAPSCNWGMLRSQLEQPAPQTGLVESQVQDRGGDWAAGVQVRGAGPQ